MKTQKEKLLDLHRRILEVKEEYLHKDTLYIPGAMQGLNLALKAIAQQLRSIEDKEKNYDLFPPDKVTR